MSAEAIILAGGFGTRLRTVVSDVPKPMAPVRGVPFLCYVLRALARQGYSRAVLATGYMHDMVEQHFGTQYEGLELCYSVEDHPLGTGGAILQALQHCQAGSVTVLNGDTFFNADLARLRRFASRRSTPLAIVLRRVDDASRYGTVAVDPDGRISAFREKDPTPAPGLINGGIYQLRRTLFDGRTPGEAFSFEKDIMQRLYPTLPFFAYADPALFIDIGIPADYARAQTLLPPL